MILIPYYNQANKETRKERDMLALRKLMWWVGGLGSGMRSNTETAKAALSTTIS